MNTTMRTAGALMVCVGVSLGMMTASQGCEKKEEPSKTQPKPPPPDVTPKAAAAAATTSPATTDSSPADAGVAAARRRASAAREREAQALLARATQAIKDNQLEEARASLDNVEQMKDAVSEATRKYYETARGNLAQVEKLQTAELPAAPTDPDNK